MARRVCAVLVALVASAAPVEAAAPRSIAVFKIHTVGTVDRQLVDAVQLRLVRIGIALGVRIVSGTKLKKRFQTKPYPMLQKCAGDVGCIARLGQRAHTDEVLAGRAKAVPGGIIVHFRVIDSERAEVLSKAAITVRSVAEVRAALRENTLALFGTEFPEDSLQLEDIPLPPDLDPGDDPPEEVVATVEPPPGPPPTLLLGGTTPSATEEEDVSVAKSGGLGTLGYTGLAVAAVGALLTGTGGIYGLKANSLESSLRAEEIQVRAFETREDQRDAARRANLFFILGGAAGAVGCGLFIAGLMTDDATADVSANGSSVSLTLHW